MAYDTDLSFIYKNPTRIVFGVNSLRDLAAECNELKCSKAFLVTDKGLVEAGLAEKVEAALGKLHVGTFDECPQDSGVHIVNQAADIAREKGADILVSLGGGSVIDTAKGVAILLKEGGKLEDHYGLQLFTRPQTPHIAIPTTAGTGSEVTWAYVVKDWEKNQKILCGDDHIIPNTAILDPVLTQGLPPRITAFTGMDALTHAIEAIHALQAEPITDIMAFGAIRLIVQYLPTCVESGDDLFARGQQQIAATTAGIAFSNAQIGLVHAAAHSAGALYGVPHGLANSILLPHVMKYNMDECADRYALVADAMGVKERGMGDEEATLAAIDAVFALSKRIGLPQKLSEVGVEESGLGQVAELSLSDGAIVYNPKLIYESEQVMEVLKEAY
ncbi:MAG: iron-containing alcohol dehydrogenase [Actinomycetota bacterium]|nr:iron-containing alcohol dehydrogenase [Actinomycetota bacterium]MDD5665718.1 iron-containing alcohol dehydrogenase [Actinomycetota bacterium]